jgi:SAM-dependent methyltransferase
MGPEDRDGNTDAAGNARVGVADEIRDFWDVDAATYDNSPSHYPRRPQEQAAWAATLRRLLPAPPAAVLYMGAGTGFLSLLLAAQGYQVTAADFAPGMLARLKAKAADRGLAIDVAETDALHPPAGTFDAVVERHLIWTLPDPAGALAAWHAAAPDHHGHYTEQMNAALPYRGGLTPDEAVALAEASPWGRARIERLRDVEWAVTDGLGPLDSLLGTHPRWAVIAGR